MGIERITTRREVRAHGLLWLAAASFYFLFAWSTIMLTSNERGIATVWPANAVLVALLLAARRPQWRTVLSAGFAANVAASLATGSTLSGAPLYGLANVLEVSVAVVLLRKHVGGAGILSSPAMVGRFILTAGVLAPSASALVGAGTAALLFGRNFPVSFNTWLLSDGLGLLIFTPVFLALCNGDFRQAIRAQNSRQRSEALILLLITALVAGGIFFFAKRPLLFLLFGPVTLVTFRVGRLGTKIAVMIIAIIGAIATIQDFGPIAALSSNIVERAQLFQLFLAVLLLTCLPVAADLSARGRAARELARRERLLSYRASIDDLTGLLNRATFQERAAEMLESADPGPHCLVAIDLDRFKDVNDRWGHHAGDMALIHLASVLRAQVRTQDVVARLGGDEFMLLLPQMEASEAEAVCNRVRTALRRMSLTVDDKTEIMLSISCGVAASRAGQGYGDLARRADKALYLAKAAGRNTVRNVA